MEEIFIPAFNWTMQREELFIVETTKIGLVNNCLSYMPTISSKSQFVEAIIKGFGSNFSHKVRSELAQEIFNLSGERPADPRNLLLNYFEEKS